MSVKQPSLRFAWYLVAGLVGGAIFGSAAAPQAAAKHQDFAGQEKDSKGKKKRREEGRKERFAAQARPEDRVLDR